MTLVETRTAPMAGAVWALASVAAFSANDMLIKFLSGDYPLHQIILIRSSVGLCVVLGLILPLAGGIGTIRTKRLRMHLLRGLAVVLSNAFFFMALAAMPLAEAVAIFFVCPLLISLSSVVFLGETVGPRRWGAILLGLAGVAIVLRPGTEAFQATSLLPLVAAVCYAAHHTITRKIGGTESAAVMLFYIQSTFVVTSALVGLVAGHGHWAGTGRSVARLPAARLGGAGVAGPRAHGVHRLRECSRRLCHRAGLPPVRGGAGRADRVCGDPDVGVLGLDRVRRTPRWGGLRGDRADPGRGPHPRLAGGGGAARDP